MSKKILKQLKKPLQLNIRSYPADLQGCGTIRIIYPSLLINHYQSMYDKNTIVNSFYSSFFVSDANYYKNYSWVTIQRAATKDQFNMVKWFIENTRKQTDTPIFYEIDDLLIDIPEWNYASDYYKKLEPFIKNIMRIVDGITVSTDKLKEIYSEFNSNISVIPNHLPKFVWGDVWPAHLYNENKKPRIGWFGSMNHFAVKHETQDGKSGGDFGSELMNFIRKTTDIYDWVICGGFPMELENVKSKIEYHPWQNIFYYPKFMKNLELDICIAPLMQNLFNECKSNIKALEFVALGCPGVYTNIEPYKKMTLKSNSDEEMISMIEDLVKDVDYRGKIWEKDKKSVLGNLWWEENNNLKNFLNSHLRLLGKKL